LHATSVFQLHIGTFNNTYKSPIYLLHHANQYMAMSANINYIHYIGMLLYMFYVSHKD